MLELEIRQPGSPVTAAQLPPGAYLIGSGADCHIRLPRPEISTRHAQLIVRENRILVMDLGSRNGTETAAKGVLYPNQPIEVPFGSEIRIGKAVLRVKQTGPVEKKTETAEAAPRKAAPAESAPDGETEKAEEGVQE